MDQDRFDRITKTLASGQSRRGVLRGLTAGLAAVLGGQAAARADHQPDHCAKEGQKPQPHKACCDGLNVGADGRCVANACIPCVSPGYVFQEGECVPLCSSDPALYQARFQACIARSTESHDLSPLDCAQCTVEIGCVGLIDLGVPACSMWTPVLDEVCRCTFHENCAV